jgi:hypothetical protein
MPDDTAKPLIIEGIDITHARLVDLTRLADQAEAFYDWVSLKFQEVLSRQESLNQILETGTEDEIKKAIANCYAASGETNLPLLFDGVGRSYQHQKACYYFFSWIIRDAPQQRLAPLIQRIVRATKGRRVDVEIVVLAALICKYRKNVKTFSWESVREVFIDRLEGSRRSIRGHEKEAVVRTALLAAIQNYYVQHANYGIYSGVVIPEGQVSIGNETYDVRANLLDDEKQCVRRILVPIKTRETEGGGHAHLFTRDIMSAINAARLDNETDYVVAVIVARNWSSREADTIRERVDHAAIFDLSPNDFILFSDEEQEKLNVFINSILRDEVRH